MFVMQAALAIGIQHVDVYGQSNDVVEQVL